MGHPSGLVCRNVANHVAIGAADFDGKRIMPVGRLRYKLQPISNAAATESRLAICHAVDLEKEMAELGRKSRRRNCWLLSSGEKVPDQREQESDN